MFPSSIRCLSNRVLTTSLLLSLLLALLLATTVYATNDAIDGANYNFPAEAVAGQQLTFTYTYLNNKKFGDFSNIKAIDKIPDGATYVSGGTYDATTREVTIDKGALATNQTATFSYTVAIPANLAGTTLKSADVIFAISIPGYGGLRSRLRFEQTWVVIEQRSGTPATTPTATAATPVATAVTPTPTPTVAATTQPTVTPATEAKPQSRTYHPGVVHPGQLITYTFQISNLGGGDSGELSDVTARVPTSTTYKSGGTYDPSNRSVTFANIPNLAAGATATLFLVVEVPADAQPKTTIDAPRISAWRSIGNGSLAGLPGMAPGKSTVEVAGTVLATYKNSQGIAFDPEIHGYSFQNYGNHAGAADDLGAADLFDLFGPTACSTGTGSNRTTCQVTAAGKQWLDESLSGMNGGHCEGMAVTAQRFFEGLSFAGKSAPGEFQSGKNQPYALVFPGQSVENYIASYFVRQTFSQVSSEAHQSRQNMTPAQIVDKLIAEFNKTPSVGYAVGIYKPGYEEGHAVTPYAIEQVGNTQIFRIVVYDNNFPGQKRYITVDKATNKWNYMAAADPTQSASLYEGDASTKTLEINRISLRDMPTGQYFPCRFCSSGQIAAAGVTSTTIEVSFSGEGEILIVDDQNRRTGYDFEQGTIVNEIPNSGSTPLKNGLGLNIPPIFQIPATLENGKASGLYQVYVSGKTIDSLTNGDLSISGAGFVMGVDAITLDKNELYRFDISPDGTEIYFEATQDTFAPSLFLAFDLTSTELPGLVVEINDMLLKAGEVAYLRVDEQAQRLYFVSTAETVPLVDRNLNVTVSALWHDGQETSKDYNVVIPAGTKSAYLDYGNWQEGSDASFIIGATSVYLPLVAR